MAIDAVNFIPQDPVRASLTRAANDAAAGRVQRAGADAAAPSPARQAAVGDDQPAVTPTPDEALLRPETTLSRLSSLQFAELTRLGQQAATGAAAAGLAAAQTDAGTADDPQTTPDQPGNLSELVNRLAAERNAILDRMVSNSTPPGELPLDAPVPDMPPPIPDPLPDDPSTPVPDTGNPLPVQTPPTGEAARAADVPLTAARTETQPPANAAATGGEAARTADAAVRTDVITPDAQTPAAEAAAAAEAPAAGSPAAGSPAAGSSAPPVTAPQPAATNAVDDAPLQPLQATPPFAPARPAGVAPGDTAATAPTTAAAQAQAAAAREAVTDATTRLLQETYRAGAVDTPRATLAEIVVGDRADTAADAVFANAPLRPGAALAPAPAASNDAAAARGTATAGADAARVEGGTDQTGPAPMGNPDATRTAADAARPTGLELRPAVGNLEPYMFYGFLALTPPSAPAPAATAVAPVPPAVLPPPVRAVAAPVDVLDRDILQRFTTPLPDAMYGHDGTLGSPALRANLDDLASFNPELAGTPAFDALLRRGLVDDRA